MSPPFLADACALVDFLLDSPGTMSEAGNRAMAADVLVSPITVWELARKEAIGKLPSLPRLRGRFADYLAAEGFKLLSLSWSDLEHANRLPPIHKDPMDRMLIAQALNADLTIITIDRLFDAYGVRTVW